MAEEEFDDMGFDDEEEQGPAEESSGGLSGPLIKLLTYVGILLGVVLISTLTAILIYELKKGDTMKPLTPGVVITKPEAKDVYTVPEFKLALDKKEDESMTTIVQVKLGVAYPKDDQQTLTDIIKRKEQLRDRIQYVIARKGYDEINTALSREEKLKQDLLYELRKIVNGEILDIYFDTFVISRVPG